MSSTDDDLLAMKHLYDALLHGSKNYDYISTAYEKWVERGTGPEGLFLHEHSGEQRVVRLVESVKGIDWCYVVEDFFTKDRLQAFFQDLEPTNGLQAAVWIRSKLP